MEPIANGWRIFQHSIYWLIDELVTLCWLNHAGNGPDSFTPPLSAALIRFLLISQATFPMINECFEEVNSVHGAQCVLVLLLSLGRCNRVCQEVRYNFSISMNAHDDSHVHHVDDKRFGIRCSFAIIIIVRQLQQLPRGKVFSVVTRKEPWAMLNQFTVCTRTHTCAVSFSAYNGLIIHIHGQNPLHCAETWS